MVFLSLLAFDSASGNVWCGLACEVANFLQPNSFVQRRLCVFRTLLSHILCPCLFFYYKRTNTLNFQLALLCILEICAQNRRVLVNMQQAAHRKTQGLCYAYANSVFSTINWYMLCTSCGSSISFRLGSALDHVASVHGGGSNRHCSMVRCSSIPSHAKTC